PRAQAVLSDPDSSLEAKFWAEIQLEAIDYFETLNAGKAQSELPKVLLRHSKALQTLTSSGPKYLKLFALIARHAAELEIMVYDHSNVFMALRQHLERGGQPLM